MSLELPVLRLGLAGFSAAQKSELDAVVQAAAPGGHQWKLSRFVDADAWWVSGAQAELQEDGNVRVAPAIPTERQLKLDLAQVNRPIAFTLPLAARNFEPAYTFLPQSAPAVTSVLQKFEAWLQPQAAQFALAARILEQESVLGTGIYHVHLNDTLLAVVNMKGDVGLLRSAAPTDFDDAVWTRRPYGDTAIPKQFLRVSLSETMWYYAVRTMRDVLPERYRMATLHFRRPPRIAPRLVTESHLRLIREIAVAPSTFSQLQARTGMEPNRLARKLAALYLVGTITSNPKRAGTTRPLSIEGGDPAHGMPHSGAHSTLDPVAAASQPSEPSALAQPVRPVPPADFTKPMPLTPH